MSRKTHYARDLCTLALERYPEPVELLGWVEKKRSHGRLLFVDIVDSTGSIQVVIDSNKIGADAFEHIKTVSNESSVRALGQLTVTASQQPELVAEEFEIINRARISQSPGVRTNFDLFDVSLTDLMLRQRHLYIRNPKVMALLRFRALVMDVVRRWFAAEDFLEFDAPILVPAPLYDDRTAIDLAVHEEPAFLSQCAGFYLEAASQAFERVYNMAPSFRGEESRSKRHLSEYWHVKAELAWGDREDIIELVESFIAFLNETVNNEGAELMQILGVNPRHDGMKTPYARITYQEAVEYLPSRGFAIEFGQSIGSAEEEELSKLFDRPFWLVGVPRSVEPFPYVIDPTDTRLTMVADLIASDGFGELLGVAEKIYDPDMLHERMQEKNKHEDERYDFVRDVHNLGCSPHIAFGMGLERAIRWLLSIPHVRDTIPFPRVAGRRFYP